MSIPNTIDVEETLLRLEQNMEDIVAQVTTLAQTMGDALQLRGSRVGGVAGQYPRKSSSTDHDYVWSTIAIGEVSGLTGALTALTNEDSRLAGLIAQRVRFVDTDTVPESRVVVFSTGGPSEEVLIYYPDSEQRARYFSDLWELRRMPGGAGWQLFREGAPIYFNSTDSDLQPPTTGWVDELNAPAAITLTYYDGTAGSPGTIWIGQNQIHFCTDTNVWRSTGVLTANVAHV